MSERGVLSFLAAVFVLIGVIVVASTVYSVSEVEREVGHVSTTHTDALFEAQAIHAATLESVEEAFAYVISGDRGERGEARALQASIAVRLGEFAASVRDHSVDGRDEAKEIAALTALHQDLIARTEALFDDFETRGSVSESSFHDFEEAVDRSSAALQTLVSREHAEVEAAQAQALQVIRTAQWLAVGQSGAVIVVVLVSALLTWRLLGGALSARDRAIEEINAHRMAMGATTLGMALIDGTDPERPLVYANRALLQMTGATFDRLRNGYLDLLSNPESDAEIAQAIRSGLERGEPSSGLVQAVRDDGTALWVDFTITPVRDASDRVTQFVATIDDVNDRIELQRRLALSQRMESVGQLAGGIAHDFNNYLTVINGSAEMLGDPDAAPTLVRELAADILQAGQRSAELTTQLLAFARQQVLEPKPHDLNAIVRSLLPLLARTIREDIEIHTDLASRLPAAHVDRSQVEQVITNLALNARDAMPSGGELTIRTLVSSEPASGTHFVAVEVRDTGRGIDPEIRDRVFEPFVSTKADGGGLGLATVFGIVEQSGGRVDLETELGRGTSVRVLFPATDAPPVESATPAPEVARARTGTVLLVEDDDMVRPFARRMLYRMGFDVIEAANGVEALEALDDSAQVDLILTDVTMPKMGGFELARRVQTRGAACGIVFMSGYAKEGLARQGAPAGDYVLLRKPFTMADLKSTLDEALAEPAPRPQP